MPPQPVYTLSHQLFCPSLQQVSDLIHLCLLHFQGEEERNSSEGQEYQGEMDE